MTCVNLAGPFCRKSGRFSSFVRRRHDGTGDGAHPEARLTP